MPVDERSVFLRSLANQTNGMKQGEHKNIVIFTGAHVYFYAATGYMNGSIFRRSGLTKKVNEEIKAWSDNYGSIDTSTTTPYKMAKGYESGRKRNGWDYDASRNSHSKRLNDAMAKSASKVNPIGDTWESNGDFETDEELIPGSIVYNGEGESFRVKKDGSIEVIDTNNGSDIRYERAEITEDEVISQSKKAMAAELTRLREILKMQSRESHEILG